MVVLVVLAGDVDVAEWEDDVVVIVPLIRFAFRYKVK